MTLGDQLKKTRIFLGLTLEEMCLDVISPSYYLSVERNKNQINLQHLIQILNRHEVSLYDFFISFTKDQPLLGEKKLELIHKAESELSKIIRFFSNNDIHSVRSAVFTIQEMPADPVIFGPKLLANYYLALITQNRTQANDVISVLEKSNYRNLIATLPRLR